MFKGSFTALITPFRNGSLDEDAFRRIVEWQIGEGTHGLVPVGTTGESPTLSHEEHKRLVELTVETAKGRVPVIAGAGSNSTSEAIDFTRHAKKVGAAAVLVVTPYYNKPTQEGLYQHFKAINDAVDIPIVIYNIPGRSVIDMSVDTMTRCFALKNVSRRQGRDRQSRARFAAAGGDGPRLRHAVGRGRHGPGLHGARRATAAFRSSRTLLRACVPNSRTPALPATTRPRWRCRIASCRCTMRCSASQIPDR